MRMVVVDPGGSAWDAVQLSSERMMILSAVGAGGHDCRWDSSLWCQTVSTATLAGQGGKGVSMRRILGGLTQRRGIAALSIGLAVLVAGGTAGAVTAVQSPIDSNGLIHACYNPNTGAVKLNVKTSCPAIGDKTPITWSQGSGGGGGASVEDVTWSPTMPAADASTASTATSATTIEAGSNLTLVGISVQGDLSSCGEFNLSLTAKDASGNEQTLGNSGGSGTNFSTPFGLPLEEPYQQTIVTSATTLTAQSSCILNIMGQTLPYPSGVKFNLTLEWVHAGSGRTIG
jgi:hypothetical protein